MALIKCSECGSSVSDKATSCPQCGNPIQGQHKTQNEPTIHCPKCHSTQLELLQKGFDGGKALAGAILFGELGVLAGMHGAKDIQLICKRCGNKFTPDQAEKILNGQVIDDTIPLSQQEEEHVLRFLEIGILDSAVSRYMEYTGITDKGKALRQVQELANNHNIQYDKRKADQLSKPKNTSYFGLILLIIAIIFVALLIL